MTRYALTKIALNKTAQSYSFVMDFAQDKAFEQSLLLNFLKYLFKAIQFKSKELFDITRETFENSLKRDPEFEKLLSKIGSGYFGIQEKQNFNLMSMMGSLFS